MRARIYKSVLIVSIITVVITFLLSAILHYQGRQEQSSQELLHMTETAAAAISKDEEEQSKEYLNALYMTYQKNIHIVWIESNGKVLFDTEGTFDRRYLDSPEVLQALQEGVGQSVQKSADAQPRTYAACQSGDNTILRFSRNKMISFDFLSDLIPEIIMFFLVFLVAALATAEQVTNRVLSPLHTMGELIQQIMNGKHIAHLPSDYDELMPLIHKLEEQHDEIQNYVDDIEEERSTMRTILDTISDGIILLNSKKDIVDYNKKTEDIFQLTKDKHFRRISFLYHDEDFLRAIAHAYSAEGRHEYTMTLFEKPFRMVTAKTELVDGETGLLIVLRDMTAYHMAEQMRREFSANVSHELKTPLTSISGYAEIISKGMYQNTEDVKLFGGRILDEVNHMISLIETIMHLSQIEETETTIKWKTVEVSGLIRYAVDLVRGQAEKKNIELTMDVTPVYVYGNAALLSELAMNLLDNAVKYNKEGGKIHTTLAQEDDKMILCVSDTGIGIPKEKQNRIFERFYRGEESRSKATGGSGLGLAICKHIVEKHKGTMNISSIEGEGTTFTVVLPAMTDEAVSKEIHNEAFAKEEASAGESGALAALEAEEMNQGSEGKAEESVENKEGKNKGKSKKEKKGKKEKKKSLGEMIKERKNKKEKHVKDNRETDKMKKRKVKMKSEK